MTHFCRSLAVACSAWGILLGAAGESRACCGWFRDSCAPAGTTTYRPLFPFRTGYRGVAATGCCTPCGCAAPCGCASPCSTCAPAGCQTCSRVAYYAPVVAYRPVMGCGSCGVTALRPVVTYQQPVYSAPAAGYQVLPSTGCSSCSGGVTSYPSVPATSQIVSQAAPAATYGSAPVVSSAPPTTTYRAAPSSAPTGTTVLSPSGSYSPPGGSFSSNPAPALSAPVVPRPGPTESFDETSSRLRGPAARPNADLRAAGPTINPPVLKNPENGDRTTQLPSYRTWSSQPQGASQQPVIQAQHVRPAKKKIDDGGWRPAK